MPTLPRDIVDTLTFKLNTLSDASKQAIADRISTIQFENIADLRNKLIAILESFFANATDIAALYATQMYEDAREYALGSRLDAIGESGRNPEATEGAIRAFVGQLETGGMERITKLLQDRIDYEIKRAAGYATSDLAMKDTAKPRFARVPTGSETCSFCIMLASRGFVYQSKESAGALEHWHPNCDCRIMPGFQGYTEIEGYDPSDLYDQYLKDIKDGNLSLKTVDENTSHIQNWSSDKFGSVSDFQTYIKGAKDIEDLQYRCAVVELEFPKTGLSKKYYSLIKHSVNNMKNELIN